MFPGQLPGRLRCGRRGPAVLVLAACLLASTSTGAIEWPLRNVFQPSLTGNSPGKAPGSGAEAERPVIFGLHAVRLGKISRLELTATRPLKADAFLLPDPARAIVDFSKTLFHIQQGGHTGSEGRKGQAEPSNAAGLIKAYRYGLLASDSSRVVVELKRAAKIAQISQIRIAPSVHRLRIDFEAASEQEFLALAKKGQQAVATRNLAAKPSAVVPAGPQTLPVIVIDPGHGGIDSGARASRDTYEKDIVFEFSKELARQLRASGKFKVVMTRESDVFVPLHERVAIAQRARAGLLISIHADSLHEGSAQGATVYTVSDRASDAHTEKLAEKENQADESAGLKGPAREAEVSDILFDLTRRETRAFSHVFAHSLLAFWQKTAKLNKNPHRSGRFIVLKAQDVPSVLLELGYLSSAADARLLGDPKWRNDTAGSVVKAVSEFFDARGGGDQAAGRQPPTAAKLAKSGGAGPD